MISHREKEGRRRGALSPSVCGPRVAMQQHGVDARVAAWRQRQGRLPREAARQRGQRARRAGRRTSSVPTALPCESDSSSSSCCTPCCRSRTASQACGCTRPRGACCHGQPAALARPPLPAEPARPLLQHHALHACPCSLAARLPALASEPCFYLHPKPPTLLTDPTDSFFTPTPALSLISNSVLLNKA